MFDGVLLAKAWKHPFRDAEFVFHTQFPNFSTRDLKHSTQVGSNSYLGMEKGTFHCMFLSPQVSRSRGDVACADSCNICS